MFKKHIIIKISGLFTFVIGLVSTTSEHVIISYFLIIPGFLMMLTKVTDDDNIQKSYYFSEIYLIFLGLFWIIFGKHDGYWWWLIFISTCLNGLCLGAMNSIEYNHSEEIIDIIYPEENIPVTIIVHPNKKITPVVEGEPSNVQLGVIINT